MPDPSSHSMLGMTPMPTTALSHVPVAAGYGVDADATPQCDAVLVMEAGAAGADGGSNRSDQRLVRSFDDRDVEPPLVGTARDLRSDESGAHDDDLGGVVEAGSDRLGVVERPHGVDSRHLCLTREHAGTRPGGDDC